MSMTFRTPSAIHTCRRFQELNLVSLDPDVRAAFPDSRAVNEALRLLIKTAKSVQEFAKAS